MSARALNWAWAQEPATATQKLVLAALADRADDDGYCYPSHRWLSEKCAPISKRTVRRAIDDLEEQGLLVKKDRRRRDDGTLSVWNYHLPISATSGHQRPLVQWPPTVEPVATNGRAEPSIEPSSNELADASSHEPVAKTDLELLWDACEKVQVAPTAKSARAAYAKIVRDLYKASWSPLDVETRAAAYKRHETLGGTMLTLAALAKWGETLRIPPPVRERESEPEVEFVPPPKWPILKDMPA